MPDYNNPKLLIMILPKTIEKQSLNILINTNHVEIFDGENTVSWLVNKLGMAYKTSSLLINKEKIVDPANCNESLNEGDVVEIKKGSKQVVSIKNVGIKKVLFFLFLKKIKLIKKNIEWKYHEYFKVPVFYNSKKIFFDYSHRKIYTRGVGSSTTEPETIKWIEGFNKGDVFWDIGSNIGIFSIMAAVNNAQVISFEPVVSNYCTLVKNIKLNNLQSSIKPLLLAINDHDSIDNMYIPSDIHGSSGNTFGRKVDAWGDSMSYRETQSVIGVSGDTLVNQFDVQRPNHLKIDVDGIEYDILKGLRSILSSNSLKSISVEINLLKEGARDKIIDLLYDNNFYLWKINGDKVSGRYMIPVSNGVCFNYLFIRK